MSWKDILKDLRPDKELRSEVIDFNEVENNFEVNGWPKYIYMPHQEYMMGVGRIGNKVALIYEYQGNRKYKLVEPHFTTVVGSAPREVEEETEDDAWGLFGTMAADARFIERNYRGTKALKELQGGGALTTYQGEMPQSDRKKFQ